MRVCGGELEVVGPEKGVGKGRKVRVCWWSGRRTVVVGRRMGRRSVRVAICGRSVMRLRRKVVEVAWEEVKGVEGVGEKVLSLVYHDRIVRIVDCCEECKKAIVLRDLGLRSDEMLQVPRALGGFES